MRLLIRLIPWLAVAVTLGLVALPGLAAGAQGVALRAVSANGVTAKPRIVAPSHKAAVRGLVEVRAEIDPLSEWARFEWSAGGHAPWRLIAHDEDPLDGWGASWRTGTASRQAILRVTDSFGGQTHIRVRIDNEGPALTLRSRVLAFSPNGDGRRDVAEVSVRAGEAATVTLQVVGPGGLVVQTKARDALLAGNRVRRFRWDGRIYDGARKGRDGSYTIRAIASDPVGNRTVEALELELDTKAPGVVWRSLEPDRLESGPVHLTFAVSDTSPRVRATPTLYDGTGRRVRTFATSVHAPGEVALSVAPDGAGDTALGTGSYQIGVLVADAAGNTSEPVRRSLLVVHPVDAAVWGRFDGARGRVALTFDDCFESGPWASILDTLARYGVKGTFFCPGQAVLANRAVALRTVREGHTIGAHGWDHAFFPKLSYGSQLQRLVDERELWWRIARTSPLPFFRPPYGQYNATTAAAAGAAGYTALVLWDVDPLDWQGPGSSVIEERIVSNTRSGSIDLMHTVWQTASALPSIITRLRARGFTLVSLPQLAAIGTPDNAHWQSY